MQKHSTIRELRTSFVNVYCNDVNTELPESTTCYFLRLLQLPSSPGSHHEGGGEGESQGESGGHAEEI